MTTAQSWPVLQAPSTWRVVDFISDLHLEAAEPETFEAWRQYMATTPANAVFVLGDLFEVWVGDDAIGDATTFESACVDVLHAASQRLSVYVMHGNRDFLMGPTLMERCTATLLADPTTFEFSGQRWLLTHGDALCLSDVEYMQFREQVRSPAWQSAFLAMPLDKRTAIARDIRHQSEARKRDDPDRNYADVDRTLAKAWLRSANAEVMIHGHTHRPACHDLGDGAQRYVMTDWDLAHKPPRAEALRLTLDQAESGKKPGTAIRPQRIRLT